MGSSIKSKFEVRDGKPVLVRVPEINFIDDQAGKPVGINQHIGRRPIAAFGNSDGDLHDLHGLPLVRACVFGLILHHPMLNGNGPTIEIKRWPPRQGFGRSWKMGLNRGGHEAGLEVGLPFEGNE